MALLLQDQSIEADSSFSIRVRPWRREPMLHAAPPAGYFTLRTMPRTFTALGPRSDASLSWIGLLI